MTLRLAGTGNLPQSLRLPERTGVEWREPERKESIEPQAGVVGGWRTFGYVVRVKESGKVDLGEVTLPYWDPGSGAATRRRRAALGTRRRDPEAPPRSIPPPSSPSTRRPPDPFSALPGLRTALGAYTPPSPTALRRPRRSGSCSRRRRCFVGTRLGGRARGAAGEGAAREGQGHAGDAGPGGARRRRARPRRTATPRRSRRRSTRAIHLAVEGATGLKSRGVLVADLPAELDAARPRRARSARRSPAPSPRARPCASIPRARRARGRTSPPASATWWPSSGAARRRDARSRLAREDARGSAGARPRWLCLARAPRAPEERAGGPLREGRAGAHARRVRRGDRHLRGARRPGLRPPRRELRSRDRLRDALPRARRSPRRSRPRRRRLRGGAPAPAGRPRRRRRARPRARRGHPRAARAAAATRST